jgi:hypothetical protein
MNPMATATRQALKTPRAAAVAGIVFAVLLSASLVIERLAASASAGEARGWLAGGQNHLAILVGLNLVPFAGIAFLWFIGVVRDRMGAHEDRFFASVFLGSGLLFVAMLFVTGAMAAGLMATVTASSGSSLATVVWQYGRDVSYTLVTIYAMRMAAVFMIATATITLRTAFMPRWLGITGYACALVLLLTVGSWPWVELIFPIWVLLISVHILAVGSRAASGVATPQSASRAAG